MHMTVGEYARERGVPDWVVRRCYDAVCQTGRGSDVRANGMRLIVCGVNQDAVDAELRRRGWLTDEPIEA